eukprot:GHVH01005693.1.p1 GENE.GHVH01005693.1~~GHVH01005693.1.p1  ORF type:complete len:156 (-),score=24.76 GHVH01005693.1:80-547(-)
MLCEQLFAPCELLAKQLQNPAATIGDMVEGAQLLISQIRSMRSDTALAALFDRVDKFSDSVEVYIRMAPHRRTNKVPRRLKQQSATAPDATLDEKSSLRRQGIEAIELVTNVLVRRFDQPGVRMLSALEDLLLRCPEDITEKEIKDKLGEYVSAM